ncbi:MAG: hypothetical protein APF81_28170 [Desulfosporosinus sp. BRH_c37]|nr:MAG: hypothetical protein APF81_28170 [Desulfosporosinus sp. BRH_c37]
MSRKVTMVLMILILGLALTGCGKSTDSKVQQQDSGKSNSQEHLTPVPQGTPLVDANKEVTKQLIAQKDVLGTQIYDQKGIVFGNITFKTGVAKDYAHELANDFLSQLKASYPDRQVTTQVVIDGKITDSISYKP